MAFKMLREKIAQLLLISRLPQSPVHQNNTGLTLDALPDDVLLEILERVPRVYLVASVSKVSQRLSRLARHRSLWIRADLSNITGSARGGI